ncbi:transcription termination factor Rho [Pseudactinotalea sp.]|uniref:transcription termination factor Rho n=1 Tax=Pseudactinotalea sp. TaxID=1926260 RepID=UPI003B3BCBB2
MTDTTETAAPGKSGSLSDLRMPELQALAGRLGITGISKMRKPQLVEAIREKRRENGQRPRAEQPALTESSREEKPRRGEGRSTARSQGADAAKESAQRSASQGSAPQQGEAQEDGAEKQPRQRTRQQRNQGGDGGQRRAQQDSRQDNQQRGQQGRQGEKGDESEQKMASLDEIIHFPEPTERSSREDNPRGNRRANRQQGSPDQSTGADAQDDSGDDDDRPGRRRRGRDRYRDRKRRQPGNARESGNDDEPEILEDDVLIPVAGVLDVLENYAFVRTSGYLPGANDVYVSLGQVKKAGLRRGDAVTGAVRQPREGESQRQKFNALVRLDSVNGAPVEDALTRAEFADLTPLHPDERIRLETTTREVTGRVVDLVSPWGKGQRVLVLAPPKAGTTATLQVLANAITTNHPEAHLMVVLVDGRPEEVTDWQRNVAGEVIASPFDLPAADHTTVAELAVERAKRLVELGQDVVILLDSLTRLARAYNVTAPPSGRALAGGVDAGAVYQPKKLVGAARNIENGGSLTIVATAAVESGSATDEVILEELGGTASSELRLVRALADRRVFPAVDPLASSTAHDDVLLTPDELAATRKLRSVLGELEPAVALETLLTRIKQSASNAELLLSVSRAE